MKLFRKAFAIASVIGLSTLLQAAPEGWTTNFEEALTKAEKEKKNLLVDFTGSDWCGWCIKLDKEVFSTDTFKKEVGKKYVPVYIDFPRDKSKMAPEQTKANDQLAQKYQVNGYPTILVVDAKGKVLVRTGYQPGGPEAYLAHLESKIKSGQVFTNLITSAASLKGIEKAKKLDEAISQLDSRSRNDHLDLMKEIIELDSENKAGLRGKYAFHAELKPLFMNSMQKFQSQNSQLLAKLNQLSGDQAKKEEFEKERTKFHSLLSKYMVTITAQLKELESKYKFTGSERQEYFGILANTYLMQKKYNEAVKALNTGIEADAHSPMAQRFKQQVTGITKQYLEKAEEKKELPQK